MAKSLRSKWKRKMKSEKRKRYAVKELNQLKAALNTKPDPTIVKLVDIKKKTKSKPRKTKTKEVVSQQPVEENTLADNVEEMEVDSKVKTYNSKLRDKDGNFPVWMNTRRIKKMKSKGKSQKKSKSKW